ncbi:MAG TPA: hypothetical protein VF175_05575 [Lacipirellula sp.]
MTRRNHNHRRRATALSWRIGFVVAALTLATGCSEPLAAPPPISAQQRQSIKHNLTQLGAKITAEDQYGLYASLRNTHVQVLESGGVVEGVPRTRRDYQDFGLVNEAVAKGFLAEQEFPQFQQWLRGALSPASPGANRTEFARYLISVSREPLRVVFSQRAPAGEEASHE